MALENFIQQSSSLIKSQQNAFQLDNWMRSICALSIETLFL